MNRDDIIRMAKEAWGEGKTYNFLSPKRWHEVEDMFVRFAVLVAAAEREACAKLVDEEMADYRYGTPPNIALNNAAAAIRARGE